MSPFVPFVPFVPSIRPVDRARRWSLAGAAVASFLTLAACGAETAEGGEARADGADVALEHVHGLGVDPADDALYAGTHYGLVRISADGELTRIADLVQDFMGFTVVGPERYLASGHPGAGQDAPSSLGLIESTDGGKTWETLSLAGAADFHALDAAGDMVYGHSGGRLLVSEGGTDWTDRGSMSIADLAVDPADPERLLATAEAGLIISEDAGKSFDAVADAPLLLLVDIDADGAAAVGVAPDGAVFASTDGGRTWAEQGTVGGAPAALTVEGERVYVAVSGGIVASTDGGATFTDLYRQR